jgi:hypothetical protein
MKLELTIEEIQLILNSLAKIAVRSRISNI